MRVTDDIEIDDGELSVSTSRSGGPGGQHANKTETRVTVSFDLAGSPSLDAEQTQRAIERLAPRLSKDGVLSVSCESERSQRRNRELAVARLAEILRQALEVETPRRRTRVPRGARRRRLEAKRRRSSLKKDRGRRWRPED
ncbi:MAG: alternative ribosome rescue aminoacyl-tRNA hydrolase ArfB [Acidobacteriota bacterium]